MTTTSKTHPADNDYCVWHALPAPHHGKAIGINKDRLYVIAAGDGYSCLGFDVAERKRRAVLAWLGKGALNVETGTPLAYAAYLDAMEAGRCHAEKTGTKCPVELCAALVGREGKQVEVTEPGKRPRRFYVGRSGGWMPCHLEMTSQRSSSGIPVMISDAARVRVI